MIWQFCITNKQKRALFLCCGEMDIGCGIGTGYCGGYGWSDGDGAGSGYDLGTGDSGGDGHYNQSEYIQAHSANWVRTAKRWV